METVIPWKPWNWNWNAISLKGKFLYFSQEIDALWKNQLVPASEWPIFSEMDTIEKKHGNHFNSNQISSLELLRDPQGELWGVFGGMGKIQQVRRTNFSINEEIPPKYQRHCQMPERLKRQESMQVKLQG